MGLHAADLSICRLVDAPGVLALVRQVALSEAVGALWEYQRLAKASAGLETVEDPT